LKENKGSNVCVKKGKRRETKKNRSSIETKRSNNVKKLREKKKGEY
jgi:hypothetical protein